MCEMQMVYIVRIKVVLLCTRPKADWTVLSRSQGLTDANADFSISVARENTYYIHNKKDLRQDS